MSACPALVFVALALLLAVQAQPPSAMRPVPDTVSDKDAPTHCPTNCSPNRAGQQRKHVCGNDGKTYPSACHLLLQSCQNPGSKLLVQSRGKCRPNKQSGGSSESQGNTHCQEARRFHASKEQENKFVPACDKDGHFLPIQCFNVYCWCVDTVSGNPIHNTYTENDKPDCSKIAAAPKTKKSGSSNGNQSHMRKASQRPNAKTGSKLPFGEISNRPKPKKACESMDRITFNKNLLNSLIVDMRRQNITHRPGNFGEIIMEEIKDPEVQRRILEHKFNMLDQNKDRVLEKKEYRTLRKFARLNVMPRRCSHSFMQRCDLNKDTKITKDEWLGCLGFDTHRTILDIPIVEEEGPGVGSSDGDSSEEPPEGKGCFFERRSAQDQDTKNLYVPNCTEDGKYLRKQCYPSTGYCFCVDEEDGKMQPGSIVLNSEPQCESRQSSSSIKSPSFMDKCNEEKKKRFIKNLKELMNNKIEYSSWSSTDKNGDRAKYEKLVSASFFDSLDKNKDHALDKKEWKEFRKIVDESQVDKQCGRRFLRYCDTDKNSRVSRTEWEACLTVKKAPATFGNNDDIFIGKPNANRRGPNPLDALLVYD
ncbi:testican-3 isoform X2 [Cloeon dipterum]|uniref:testican-3 isoform X2 n=1 Tax=Cloeon dipterum TaxID=197152 RepID=UPI00321F7470